jgi:hypothetical protein
MSAFQVSDAHISVLVYARAFVSDPYGGPRTMQKKSDTELGRALVLENARSVEFRYRKPVAELNFDGAGDDYTYERPRVVPSIVAMLKAIDCYEYQACEHDAWEESDARHFCSELRVMLTQKLPGWEEAPWSIPDVDPAQVVLEQARARYGAT